MRQVSLAVITTTNFANVPLLAFLKASKVVMQQTASSAHTSAPVGESGIESLAAIRTYKVRIAHPSSSPASRT